MKAKLFLGIEIGGTKIQLFLGDEKGRITKRYRTNVGKIKQAATIRKAISEIIQAEILPANTIKAVGIGFGGPVDKEQGLIIKSNQVHGWDGFGIIDWVGQLTDAPVFLENDANLAALAEACVGAGKNAKRVFYITMGSGIGGGFIIDQSIYHGRKAGEAEIGHIRLNKEGVTFESECSGWAVDKKVRDAIGRQPNSKLAQLASGTMCSEARFLKQALELECETARLIFSELTDNIAFTLSHVVHLLNPDKIIIGGGLSLMGKVLADAVQQKISRYLLDALLPAPEIYLSALQEDVVVTGALLLAIKNSNKNS